jgi:hypothetical protein
VALTSPISTEDFRTLNRCLDDAIAGAVTESTDVHERSPVSTVSQHAGASASGSSRMNCGT